MPYSNNGHVPHPERKNSARDYIELMKRSSQCHFCEESDPVVLDFHHINPADKLFGISNAWRNRGREKIEREIAKCIVVCANCHRRIHAGTLSVEEKK